MRRRCMRSPSVPVTSEPLHVVSCTFCTDCRHLKQAQATVHADAHDISNLRAQEHMAADSPSSPPAFTSPQRFHVSADSRC